MNEMHAISLGAGVQSSTMALMAAAGEITPMPDAAIFADTQAEPRAVYEWLDWLEKQLPFPVYRVTAGSLYEGAVRIRISKDGRPYLKNNIPVFMKKPDGTRGIMMRHCTADFKIDVIQRKIRELREDRQVVQWIGISWDEVHRMNDSRKSYISNRWPLIDLRVTRQKCKEWMERNGFPEPPRSACSFCPFHSDSEWKRLKDTDPQSFAEAVRFEKDYQDAFSKTPTIKGTPFLHGSLEPLENVSFDESTDQLSLFGNECEGMCGV